MDKTVAAIVILDITALLMTAGWVVYSVYKGTSFLEVFYNYIYIIVVMSSSILNIIKLVG